MKKNVLLLVLAACLVGCANGNVNLETENDTEVTDSQEVSDELYGKSLNDIRFSEWEYGDWLDNDYIREVRRYLDGYNSGVIEDEKMEPYRELVKGKFVIGSSEPFLLGGLFLKITFLDAPDKIFDTWVYSDVNEYTGAITGYRCYGLHLVDEDSGFTKEMIFEIMQEHPELKMW